MIPKFPTYLTVRTLYTKWRMRIEANDFARNDVKCASQDQSSWFFCLNSRKQFNCLTVNVDIHFDVFIPSWDRFIQMNPVISSGLLHLASVLRRTPSGVRLWLMGTRRTWYGVKAFNAATRELVKTLESLVEFSRNWSNQEISTRKHDFLDRH